MRKSWLMAFLLLLSVGVHAEVFESWPGTAFPQNPGTGDRLWFKQALIVPANAGTLPWTVSDGTITTSQTAVDAGEFHILFSTGIFPNVYGTWHIPFVMSDNAEGGDVGVWIGRGPYDFAGSAADSAVWFDYDTAHDLGVRTEAGPGGVAHYCGQDQNFATSINIRDGEWHTITLVVSALDITFQIDDSTEVCSAQEMGVGPFAGTPTMIALGLYARDTTGAVTDAFGEISWDRQDPEGSNPGNPISLIKPDATAGLDNLLIGSAANTNFATNNFIAAKASANQRSVLKFDLSGYDPEVDTCVSATMRLTTRASGVGGEHNISAILVGNDGWTEAGSTWNKKDGTNDWAGSAGASTSGTDFNATPMGTFTAHTADGRYNDISLDCSQVQLWFGSEANYGAVVWNTSGDGDQFYSSDDTAVDRRPHLVIELEGQAAASNDEDDDWGVTWTNGMLRGKF